VESQSNRKSSIIFIRCLICHQIITEKGSLYHQKCAIGFFESFPIAGLQLDEPSLNDYIKSLTRKKIAIPGVQKKLSLDFLENTKSNSKKEMKNQVNAKSSSNEPNRFTIRESGGRFIVKLPTKEYPFLTELEFMTMHLAKSFGITTVPFALIPITPKGHAFITKRIDRQDFIDEYSMHNIQKIPMEDFCQINERLTEDKYKGSLESIGKKIKSLSTYPGLDLYNFYLMNLFSWLVGNSDMHLKNFSLYLTSSGLRLTPAYDLLATQILLPMDKEETALTLNGKKAKFKSTDWNSFSNSLDLNQQTIKKLHQRISKLLPDIYNMIPTFPIPKEFQKTLKTMIRKRWMMLEET
jgi:serine/threonine-protein kinase HipA